ncbi:4'-phosphopantetheinyl transferase family protein [Paraflavitalea soli]|uniref:4'-phosphopantetheinyl transferase family protein n=1 Tax=Paraflavitalea soli TaxID=2315862 RepID=UPI0037426F3B
MARYLPPAMHQQMQAYRFEQDSCRYLLGKMLLLKGLVAQGYHSDILSEIQYNEFNKPWLDETVSFNISHSGDHIICAVSKSLRVGIDIEEVKPTELTDFTDCFSAAEWQCIRQEDNLLTNFYRFWTRKEAVLKADGRGLGIPLKELEVVNDQVLVGTAVWHLKALDILEGYAIHMASSEEVKEDISLRAIQF